MQYFKFFDAKKNSILYFRGANDGTNIWDQRWSAINVTKKYKQSKNQSFVSFFTKKYLKQTSKIIDAGCGIGDKVQELKNHGFVAYGIDNAKATISKVKSLVNNPNISYGDVRQMNFSDNFFDGYWSLGVIEHDINGFDTILQEMVRVIRPNGFVFVTFPSMNLVRRIKKSFGLYKKYDKFCTSKYFFYQYIYDPAIVEKKFIEYGFTLLEKKRLSGIYGLLEEFGMHNNKDNGSNNQSEINKKREEKNVDDKIIMSIKNLFDKLTSPWAGHLSLYVYKNEK